MATVPPTVDGLLLPWSLNFSTRISATPTVFDLTATEAAAYAALHTDYTTKLAVADNPGTRTRAAIAAKNTSKAALLARARQFAKVIKASPTVTDAQRIDLGLPVRDGTPTPVPPPASRPLLVVDPFGNVAVRDEASPTHRRKPTGAIGAVLFAAVLPDGQPAPTTPDEARYAGVATRDKFAVPLPEDAGGKFLYVMAQWLNGKGQPGPVSTVAVSRIAA